MRNGISARRIALMFVAAFGAAVVAPAFAGQAPAQPQRPAAQGTAPAQPQQPAAAAAAAQAAAPLPTVPNLQTLVQRSRDAERKVAQERETRFNAALKAQQEATQKAIGRRNAAEARSAALDKEFAANEKIIAETNELLKQQTGNLGELFGVTRQVAGDAASVLQDSLLTTQFRGEEGEERAEFLRRLAGAKELPSLPELTRFWQELLREMVSSGQVAAYNASVMQLDKTVQENVEVVRTGPFTAVANGVYLGYLPSEKSLTVLDGNLAPPYQEPARRLQAAAGQQGYVPSVVDPARGSIIGLFLDRPSWFERIEQGEAVNYVILAVGIIGFVLAMIQAGHLAITRSKVRAQLQQVDQPKANNPLGRVLIAAREGKAKGQTPEMLELQISEAVLRELPALERFQAFLRLAVSAGPLLGLIGTVIGMIITFKVIVASGTSDPKLMATGIGQAMIATVLGLGIAIPLLFVNSFLGAMSRGIIQILDEESQSMLAKVRG